MWGIQVASPGRTQERNAGNTGRGDGMSKVAEARSSRRAEELVGGCTGRFAWSQAWKSGKSGKEGGLHLRGNGSRGRNLRGLLLLPAQVRAGLASERETGRKHLETKPKKKAV